MARYIQKNLMKAKQEGFIAPYGDDWEDYYDLDYTNGIWRINDDGSMDCVATDGGEPEDNSFVRDGAWIVGELNRAFENGFGFGFQKGEEQVYEDAQVDANETAWQEGYDQGFNEGYEIGFEEGIEEARNRI